MTPDAERRYIVEITDPTSGETITVEATSRKDVEEALDLIWRPITDDPDPDMREEPAMPPEPGRSA